MNFSFLKKHNSVLTNSIEHGQKRSISLCINWMVIVNPIEFMQLCMALTVHVRFDFFIVKGPLHNSFNTSVNDFLGAFVHLNQELFFKSGDLVKELWCPKLLASVNLILNPSKTENFLPFFFSQSREANELLKFLSTHSLFAHVQKVKSLGWCEEVFDLSKDLWREVLAQMCSNDLFDDFLHIGLKRLSSSRNLMVILFLIFLKCSEKCVINESSFGCFSFFHEHWRSFWLVHLFTGKDIENVLFFIQHFKVLEFCLNGVFFLWIVCTDVIKVHGFLDNNLQIRLIFIKNDFLLKVGLIKQRKKKPGF